MTSSCLKRGGYKAGGVVDYSKATCEAHELIAAHAAAQQRIGGLEKALNDALPLLALLAGKNDTMAEAAWQHGLAALRHPERI